MMREFLKYHSLGNDFVIIDWFKRPESYLQSFLQHEAWPAWVKQVCTRHTGVGADGVLIVRGNTEAGVPEIIVYNADGSLGQTCLNGLRAVAHYLVEYWRLPASLTIKMGQRLYSCEVGEKDYQDSSRLITTRMQVASVQDELVLTIQEEKFIGTRVSIGNPHYILLRSIDMPFLQKFGPLLESHAAFPDRTNVEFVWQDCHQDDLFHLLVYERGCGITNACSSGAAATFGLLYTRGTLPPDKKITIAMPGGQVIGWISGEDTYLQARSVEVFSGVLAQKAHIR